MLKYFSQLKLERNSNILGIIKRLEDSYRQYSITKKCIGTEASVKASKQYIVSRMKYTGLNSTLFLVVVIIEGNK